MQPNDTESQAGSNDSDNRIIQSIYDLLLRTAVVDYASQMHKLIKTGGIAASKLKTPSSRHEVFPSLYEGKSKEEVQEILDHFATEIPTRHSRKRKKIRHPSPPPGDDKVGEGSEDGDKDDDDDGDEDFKMEDEEQGAATNGASEATTEASTENADSALTAKAPTSSPKLDIWGRMPSKESPQPVVCTLCGRAVSSSRFASHLEKCMGISTRPSTGIPSRSVAASGSSLK